MERERSKGKKTALDSMPVLNESASELWHLYCFIGNDVLTSVDIYSRQIGLPIGFSFLECVDILSKMIKLKNELKKAKKAKTK